MWRSLLIAVMCALAGCGGKEDALEEYATRPVKLPDGTTVRAEVMIRDTDMMRGMMFRDKFPEGRAMLFIHGKPGKYSYYMFQVKLPLDIVWLDNQRRIVEIAENVPPCTTKASECPNYGGTKEALMVLELPGGYGRKHGIRIGEVLSL
jgi:uncharacterized protein